MRTFRDALRQPALVHQAVAYEVATLLFAAWAFHVAPNTAMFARFSRELGAVITADLFAALCLAFTLPALAVPFVRTTQWQRWLYTAAPTPLLLYMLTYGFYLWLSRSWAGLGPVVYLLFWLAFYLIGRATFRDCLPATDRGAADD